MVNDKYSVDDLEMYQRNINQVVQKGKRRAAIAVVVGVTLLAVGYIANAALEFAGLAVLAFIKSIYELVNVSWTTNMTPEQMGDMLKRIADSKTK